MKAAKLFQMLLIGALTALLSAGVVLAQDEALVLADFEDGELFVGKDADDLDIGFVAWGDRAGNVVLELVDAADDLALPDQDGANTILRVTYDIATYGGFTHALTDGEAWTPQDWTDYTALDFWLYGAETGSVIQVEIFDNRAPDSKLDTAERWFYQLDDDFSGWQFFSIPFSDFRRRADWQPSGAPSDGLGLTEVHGYSFTFPPRVGEHVAYLDNVALSRDEDAVAVDTPPASQSTPIALPPYDPDGEWELVWSDEFDAAAGEPINTEYWTCEIGGHGWGNAQLEHNTDRVENVSHDGEGYLAITAREESYRGNDYTSGRCNTMDKVEFTYGRVEARIKVTEGQGLWPAFWMLGADFPEIGWPASGEIDIMENIGREPRSTHGTVHGPEYHGIGGLGMRYIFPEPMAQDFHVFGIEWEPEVIHWTVNGEIFHTMTPESLWGGTWVFDHDFFMLINVAVGGRLGGDPDNTTVFPQTMLVDWVRVYQRVGE
ncbi:MAG TPA: family 16 glycosylhydrolase [Aggregatilineales bacterium]|nr:family 16 glycosylhydrolase [Aggregatilineales bacterium]